MTYTSVKPAQSAVIVIDMVNDFIYPGGVIADAGGPEYQARAQALIPRLRDLLESAREAGVEVIYSGDMHTNEDIELKKWPPHAMAGTNGCKIVSGIAPVNSVECFPKNTYSPFQSTVLRRYLKDRGIERLYITGLHTDCCCRHTSGDAFQYGLELVWVTDGMTAFTEEGHKSGLEYFKTWYATDPENQFKTCNQVIEDFDRTLAEVAVGK